MRALVTGGAGFVGTNLIKRLLKDGYEVITFDNYSTGYKENEQEGCKYIEYDIREKFDFESGISDFVIRDYYKERKPGQSITDWLDTKPRSYFLNIPLELAEGGKVIDFLSYLKQKEKPKIKKLNLDSVAIGKSLSELTEAERAAVNKLLRLTFGKGD